MADVLLYDVVKLALQALERPVSREKKAEAIERLQIIKKALERVKKGK